MLSPYLARGSLTFIQHKQADKSTNRKNETPSMHVGFVDIPWVY